jgi:hypothetical protein
MSRIRIHWSDEEKEALLKNILHKIQKNPRRSILDIIEEAQIVELPEYRRRKILSLSMLPWLKEKINNLKIQVNDTTNVVNFTKNQEIPCVPVKESCNFPKEEDLDSLVELISNRVMEKIQEKNESKVDRFGFRIR